MDHIATLLSLWQFAGQVGWLNKAVDSDFGIRNQNSFINSANDYICDQRCCRPNTTCHSQCQEVFQKVIRTASDSSVGALTAGRQLRMPFQRLQRLGCWKMCEVWTHGVSSTWVELEEGDEAQYSFLTKLQPKSSHSAHMRWSGTGALPANPLSPMGCEVNSLWTGPATACSADDAA